MRCCLADISNFTGNPDAFCRKETKERVTAMEYVVFLIVQLHIFISKCITDAKRSSDKMLTNPKTGQSKLQRLGHQQPSHFGLELAKWCAQGTNPSQALKGLVVSGPPAGRGSAFNLDARLARITQLRVNNRDLWILDPAVSRTKENVSVYHGDERVELSEEERVTCQPAGCWRDCHLWHRQTQWHSFL